VEWKRRWPFDPNRQDALCGEPAGVKLRAAPAGGEGLECSEQIEAATDLDPAKNATRENEPRRQIETLVLESGDCDAIRIFGQDGQLGWCRR